MKQVYENKYVKDNYLYLNYEVKTIIPISQI